MNVPLNEDRAGSVEQASEWLVRLQDPQLSEADLDAWLTWMEASPEHARAFDDLARLWDLAGSLDPKSILAARTAAEASPPPVSRARRPERRQRRWRWLAAAAAVLVVVLVGGLFWQTTQPVSTAVGERRHLVLEDGSTIDLDASSAVRVTYRADGRHLALLRGRAYFSVAHDPSRPFRVVAGDVVSVALGTRFGVDLRADRSVAVTVAEGRVQVDQSDQPDAWQRVIGHDQQLRVTSGQTTPSPQTIDSEMALDWRQGHMIYKDEPLANVIADLNRYSRVPVRLQDPALGSVKVTGLWDSTHTDRWIDGLARVLGLDVVRQGDGIVLTRPAR